MERGGGLAQTHGLTFSFLIALNEKEQKSF